MVTAAAGTTVGQATVVPLASAQEILITVETNDSDYEEGDTILISGRVTTMLIGTPILVQIFDQNNSLVYIQQLEVSQDKRYSHHILAEGPKWNRPGDYTAKISYGIGNVAEAQFGYTPKSDPATTENVYEVDAGPNHGTFDVKYSIRGAAIKEMLVDQEMFSLIVRINATDDGTIRLDLDRDYIGAEKQDGKDEIFIVTIDEKWVRYDESPTHSDTRSITIEFEGGDSEIAIIGTYVVPEFGAAAMAVVAAAMAALVAGIAAATTRAGARRTAGLIRDGPPVA